MQHREIKAAEGNSFKSKSLIYDTVRIMLQQIGKIKR